MWNNSYYYLKPYIKPLLSQKNIILMKDLLKQIHTIVDVLKKATSSRIDQLSDENNKKYNSELFNEIDKEITQLGNRLSGYETPFYTLEAIYFLSPNFDKKLLKMLEFYFTDLILEWAETDKLVDDIYSKYDGVPLPENYVRLTKLTGKINNIFTTVIFDINKFCNLYLDTDFNKTVSYMEHQFIAKHFSEISNQFKITIKGEEKELNSNKVEEFVKAVNTIEQIRGGAKLHNSEKTIEEILNEDPNNINKIGYNVCFISDYTFTYSENDNSYDKIHEIGIFLNKSGICKADVDVFTTALNNNSNNCETKLLWNGTKSDAIRIVDYLKISISEFNNCFKFEDNKKLQRKHESKDGASLLSDFLLRLNRNNMQSSLLY